MRRDGESVWLDTSFTKMYATQREHDESAGGNQTTHSAIHRSASAYFVVNVKVNTEHRDVRVIIHVFALAANDAWIAAGCASGRGEVIVEQRTGANRESLRQ